MITAEQLAQFSPNAAPYINGINACYIRFNINTPKRICAFIAQIAEESADFTHVSENLNYSADALKQHFYPRHFTLDELPSYAHHAEAIANRIYADREGNGDEESGDGWKYRGRGLIQITFKNNYDACGKALELDLINNPDHLVEPMFAALSAGWYWDNHNLNQLADEDDFIGITKAINGGINGELTREANWKRAQTIWY